MSRYKTLGAINTFKEKYRKLPHLKFAIIGFPKCGTSSLLHNLNKHPDIQMPKKEMRVSSAISSRQYNGFKYPEIIYHENRIDLLLQHNPDIKFIIGIRRPEEWFFSFFNYRKLEEKQGKIKRRNVSFHNALYDNAPFHGVLKDGGNFYKYINNVLKKTNNVYIYDLTSMQNSPIVLYKKIFKFLNINPQKYDFSGIKKINVCGNQYTEKLLKKDKSFLGEYYKEDQKKLKMLLQ